jgi:inosose dehydratase
VLGPLLQRHGLALVSGWYSAQLVERDAEAEARAVESHLTLLAALGCKVMVFAEGHDSDAAAPLSQRPTLAPRDWERFCARLGRIATHLRARGVRLAFHHHMGTVVQTEDEIDRLMRDTPSDVGLLLDTGHLAYAGGDPVAVAGRHAGRIVHVHCKDVRADVLRDVLARDTTFLRAVLDGVFTVPGDGSIDYEAVLAPLARAGYSGWLVVEAEQDPARAHPLTYARMGYANLRTVAQALWP